MQQPRHLDGTYAKSYRSQIKDVFRELFTRRTYYTFVSGTVIVLLTSITLYLGSIQPLLSQFRNQIIEPAEAQVITQVITKEEVIREVTMYTSTPEQTDSSPCIGANTQDVCVLWKSGQNICATNAFPIGTEIKVDKLGSCLVVDRMNSRFQERIDWYAGYDDDCLNGVDKGDYCPNYQRAVNFGLQNLLVSIK